MRRRKTRIGRYFDRLYGGQKAISPEPKVFPWLGCLVFLALIVTVLLLLFQLVTP